MIVDGTPCLGYAIGHNPHWIQAKLSWNSPGRPGRAASLGDGWVAIELDDGQELRRWCHDDDRLGLLLATTDQVQLRSHGVLTGPDGYGLLVSLAGEPSPCVAPKRVSKDASPVALVE